MEAIILAGGKGTRLQSVVYDIPKPMAPINEKPFLCYVLDELSIWGFQHVILSVGYKKEVIEAFFGDDYNGMRITYSKEDEPLGTGGAIKKALEYANNKNVFILNGDTFFKINYKHMLEFHMTKKSALTVALKQMFQVDRYGIVITDGDRIIEFLEKQFRDVGFINGGVYLFHKSSFDMEQMESCFSFEVDFLQKYYSELTFDAFKSEGYFIDIGIPEDYQRAQIELK